ncbi:hypothetical protein NKG05_29805 [Oerskovia sp. M15]
MTQSVLQATFESQRWGRWGPSRGGRGGRRCSPGVLVWGLLRL